MLVINGPSKKQTTVWSYRGGFNRKFRKYLKLFCMRRHARQMESSLFVFRAPSGAVESIRGLDWTVPDGD